MAKSIKINGVTYSSVPYVNIPLSEGEGNAKFVDTDGTTAAASDLRNGKTAYVNGSLVTGSVPIKNSSDLTVSGNKVTAPAGIYDADASATVATGSATPTVAVTGNVLGTATSDYPIEITPKATVGSAGYITAITDGAKVTKYVQVETKTATPTTSAQTISPSSGKLLKSVTVKAVNLSATASESDVMKGKTFFAGSLGIRTGTLTVPSITQDTSTKVLTIA